MPRPPLPFDQSRQLVRTVAEHLSLALSRTDDAYFLLTDMHVRGEGDARANDGANESESSDGDGGESGGGGTGAGGLKVTTSAVNAVLEACGRLHQLDRTFATFDDVRHVFDLTPDLVSYNALLLACAQPRAPQAGE